MAIQTDKRYYPYSVQKSADLAHEAEVVGAEGRGLHQAQQAPARLLHLVEAVVRVALDEGPLPREPATAPRFDVLQIHHLMIHHLMVGHLMVFHLLVLHLMVLRLMVITPFTE